MHPQRDAPRMFSLVCFGLKIELSSKTVVLACVTAGVAFGGEREGKGPTVWDAFCSQSRASPFVRSFCMHRLVLNARGTSDRVPSISSPYSPDAAYR